MNIERLHAIVKAISADVKKYNYPAKLEALVVAFQRRVDEPSDGSHVKEADKIIADLRDNLPNIDSNNFPSSWKEFLREYRAQDLIGEELQSTIDTILQENGLTPSIARDQLKDVADDVSGDIKSLQEIEKAFNRFKLPVDNPKPGEAEVGILVPRAAVHNGLTEFGKELSQLSKIVKVFQEIATGTREDPQINSIASSDLSIFLLLDPATALRIMEAISHLIETYKTILKIKRQVNELRETVPTEKLTDVVDHANGIMKSKITALTEEIVSSKNGIRSEKRKKEIHIELEGALEAVAIRIDKGFEFEVRATPSATKDGETKTADQVKRDDVLRTIESRQGQLAFVRSNGQPILALPGKLVDDEGPAQAQPSPAPRKPRRKKVTPSKDVQN
jgi:hypothetical protein